MSENNSYPISPLRKRMLDEMSIRQFSDKTQATTSVTSRR